MLQNYLNVFSSIVIDIFPPFVGEIFANLMSYSCFIKF